MYVIPEGAKLYHITLPESLDAVLREGLVPGDHVTPRGVYFWYRLEWALKALFPGEVLLAVDASGLEVESDPTGSHFACYSRCRIPPQRIAVFSEEEE